MPGVTHAPGDGKDRTGRIDINPYALTGDAEFFAVMSEYFFQQPEVMAEEHPEIFKMSWAFYRQG